MDDQGVELSVVATSRNDDHGANLRRRMQTFVSAFIAQCQRHDLAAELILVEWNPPADRPRLAQALRWPADTSPCQVRIVEVPEALHRRLAHAEKLPLFQMIAKNVGIRRARGRYVLATNIDILFNDELMHFLKGGGLQPGKVYRIDRTDVETDVPEHAPVEEQLAYCRGHHLRLNSAYGTLPLSPDGLIVMGPDDVAGSGMGILSIDGASAVERDAEGQVFRWGGGRVRVSVQAPVDRPRRLLMELSPGPSVGRLPAAVEILRKGRVVARGDIHGRSAVLLTLPVTPGEVADLELRAVEGGQLPPPYPDSRVLDFAIHRLRWSEEAPQRPTPTPEGAFTVVAEGEGGRDVVSPAGGVRLGRGWHELRSRHGVSYRWADSGAKLVLDAGAAGLRLWVGGGPRWRKSRRTTLQLCDEQGRVLAEAALGRGPHRISLPLPVGAGAPGPVALHVLEDGIPIAGGRGVQAFRVFSCARSDAPWGRHLGAAARALGAGLVIRTRRALRRLARRRGLPRTLVNTRVEEEDDSPPMPALHTNACGDFTLMAREHWLELNAYPELELYSLHIDSLLLYAAHAAGLEEVVLEAPMRAYHIEHSAGSGWTPEGEARLFQRLQSQGIPVLTLDDLYAMGRTIAERRDPTLFCRPDWGFAGQRLPETRPGRAARAAAA